MSHRSVQELKFPDMYRSLETAICQIKWLFKFVIIKKKQIKFQLKYVVLKKLDSEVFFFRLKGF